MAFSIMIVDDSPARIAGVSVFERRKRRRAHCLCELANIICGATLVRLAGDAWFS